MTVAFAAGGSRGAPVDAPTDAGGDADAWAEEWRARELSRLDHAGVTYLDYTGAPPFAASLLEADANRLRGAILGNPHSASAPSQRSTADVDAARSAILAFLHADPAEYTVVLTANASAACRLVGEGFPFGAGSVYAYAADNHNSVNGIREQARARGAAVRVIGLDGELRMLDDPELAAAWGGDRLDGPSLLAYPAQSNFSGVRHPLELVDRARAAGWSVLLDAAAYLPTADVDLRVIQPDFLCLSLYKISGYPTGVGALVARREALRALRRPSFAGGTVRWVSVAQERHLLAEGPEAFEDGTPNFHALGAVPMALDAVRRWGRGRLARQVQELTRLFLAGLTTLRHRNGAPRAAIHGPRDMSDRGATVAFNLLRSDGRPIPFWEVEESARGAGVALRGGCFCNPGCSERAFAFAESPMARCLDTLGDEFTVPAFAACMGDREVGALRVSFGLGSVRRDVERALEFLETLGSGTGARAVGRRAQDSNL